MLRILICLILFISFGVSGLSQSLDVSFNYSVTYQIPSLKRNTVDTLEVKMDKEGHYLYTESNSLGLDFATSVFSSPTLDLSSATSSILLDTKRMIIYFNFEIENNVMFFKMDLDKILPNVSDTPSEDMNLISEKLSNKLSIDNSNYDAYLIYPESEPENPLTVAIDSKRPVDNVSTIGEFFKMMLRKSNSEGDFNLDIPDGLIVSIKNGDEVLLEAIQIKDEVTKINIHHSFKITE